MESLGYVLLALLKGSLPWDQGTAESDDTAKERAELLKTQLRLPEDLPDDAPPDAETMPAHLRAYLHEQGIPVPDELMRFLRHTWNIDFDEKPDYAWLRGILRGRFARMGYKNDKVFDWTRRLWRQVENDDFDD